MKEKIGIASDHAGFQMKEEIKKMLLDMGYDVIDYGTHSEESCDYPDFAHQLGFAIDQEKVCRGIAICGSGNGISMALNKHPKVRAALCWTTELARLSREHNDANVLSLPARFISLDTAKLILQTFLQVDFSGGRHLRRVEKIALC